MWSRFLTALAPLFRRSETDALLIAIRIIYPLVCGGAIVVFLHNNQVLPELPLLGSSPFWYFVLLLVITQIATFLDILLPRKRIEIISAIYFGVLVGMLLSYLVTLAISPLLDVTQTPAALKPMVQLLATLTLIYLCVSILLQTKDNFRFIIPYIEFSKEVRGGRPYLLDTSSIIDGRIADVLDTRIIDSQLIIPSFVLQELQDIADSNDKLRRNRGRRGLDVLARLQANAHIEVKLYEVKNDDVKGQSVDQRLVGLAKKLGGRVVTNDFNLNKVASVQGVDVINLNDLANCLKPRYLPGERLTIKVIKAGESPGQGVGYLDDGTMVVCEEGVGLIGKDSEVVVKTVLQSSAGRMIFARLPNASDR